MSIARRPLSATRPPRHVPALGHRLCHLAAQLLCGLQARVADHERDAGAVGPEIDRAQVGIRTEHTDVLEQKPELLAHDHREHGVAALADVVGTGEHPRPTTSVEADLNRSLRHFVGIDRVVGPGNVGAPRNAQALAVAVLAALARPLRGLLDRAQAVQKTVRADSQLVDGGRVLADVVATAKLDGIEPELDGRLVELNLDREAWLHRAVPPLGATGRLVRVRAGTVKPIGRELVGRAQELPRVVGRHQPKTRVGAAVQDGPRPHTGDLPLLGEAGRVFHLHRMATTVGVEHLLAGVETLHRAPGDHGPAWRRKTRGRRARTCRRRHHRAGVESRESGAAACRAPWRARGAGSG